MIDMASADGPLLADSRGATISRMSDSQDDLRRALREVADELARSLESVKGVAREMGDDLTKPGGPLGPRRRKPKTPEERTAADDIRDLAALRDEGHISQEEFEIKKSELLSRL